MVIPQLRVRTEFTYRSNYGPIPEINTRLKELGNPPAGIVDFDGTWGVVDWAAGVDNPLFGAELVLPREDGHRATYWLLAEELPALYRAVSSPPISQAEVADLKGVVRFAGSALTDPAAIDYIDINPRSRMRTREALALSKKICKSVVITSDNDYPALRHKNRFLAWDDSLKMTPQHILNDEEMRVCFGLGDDDWAAVVRNTTEAAERCEGLKLGSAPIISVKGNFLALVEEGRKYRIAQGHIKNWTEEYQARMDRELKMIIKKKYQSYFMMVADMIVWAKERMLVGPGRGSSAGSLVSYLLRITEVDPLPHELIFERFIDVTRSDLPDIDVDFNDQKRHLVFEYMEKKYGAANTSRIGSINRLKPRSVLAHVGKKLGIPHGATFSVLNVLYEYSSGDARYGKGLADTLVETTPGKEFLKRYPEAVLMGELENHASHTGVHAAGFIVCNEPITNYCSVRDGVAQIDKYGSEVLNLLKIDVLGLRTLGVIEDAGCVTSEKLYGLTLDDPEVFRIFNEKKYSGVFQFEGQAQRSVANNIPIDSFEKIDHITALARPGPLGGGAAAKYAKRNNGTEPIEYRHPSMKAYLAETKGIVLYQEQVMRISFEIGKFPWELVAEIRKAMSGSKGEEYFDRRGKQFIEGAKQNNLTEAEAKEIWGEIVTFGGWGMNKSHTVSYSIISYWCAYMKRYHPLKYAAALLRNAKDDVQTMETLRELAEEGIEFVPFDADHSEANWSVQSGKLYGGYSNLKGIGPIKAAQYIDKRTNNKLIDKDRAALLKREVKHKDLSPAHTLWGDMYNHPENYNIHGSIKQFAELKDQEYAVVICQAVKLSRVDENERRRIEKRGGEVWKGQSMLLDAFMVDDSIAQPARVRIRPGNWNTYGEKMADRTVAGVDWFLVRGKWLKMWGMMIASKVKCLTNKELFK